MPENPSQFLESGKEEINMINSCPWPVLKEYFSCLQERQALLDSKFLGWSSHPETISKLSLEGWAWAQFILWGGKGQSFTMATLTTAATYQATCTSLVSMPEYLTFAVSQWWIRNVWLQGDNFIPSPDDGREGRNFQC